MDELQASNDGQCWCSIPVSNFNRGVYLRFYRLWSLKAKKILAARDYMCEVRENLWQVYDDLLELAEREG